MTASTANIGQVRYRSYYYDAETGLYYLQSRYYDPETGRFLNADGYISTGQGFLGTNMFAYCENNPVNMVDIYGEFAISATIGGIAIWKIGALLVTVIATLIVANTIVQNPPIFRHLLCLK